MFDKMSIQKLLTFNETQDLIEGLSIKDPKGGHQDLPCVYCLLVTKRVNFLIMFVYN